MIIIAIVLSLVGFVCLCWLPFVLAVHALPFFVGVTVGLAAYHSGSGLVAAVIVAAVASGITFSGGRFAFATLPSPLARAAIALFFAIPAAVAGYHATLGLARLVVPVEAWREAMAIMGAILVAAIAVMHLIRFVSLDPGRACRQPEVTRFSHRAEQRSIV